MVPIYTRKQKQRFDTERKSPPYYSETKNWLKRSFVWELMNDPLQQIDKFSSHNDRVNMVTALEKSSNLDWILHEHDIRWIWVSRLRNMYDISNTALEIYKRSQQFLFVNCVTWLKAYEAHPFDDMLWTPQKYNYSPAIHEGRHMRKMFEHYKHNILQEIQNSPKRLLEFRNRLLHEREVAKRGGQQRECYRGGDR